VQLGAKEERSEDVALDRVVGDTGKHGESLMRSEAEAWGGTGVTSNSLVPGFVLTPLNARLQEDPAQISALAARTMIGRNGVPADFASAAVFLAGAGSSYVTGQSIFIDGGMSVH
jgi:gluconate 5-dehydrogenase